MSEPEQTGTASSVEIAETPHGDNAHILVDGEPLCHRNRNAEYEECDELPEGGLCGNCKQRGELIGLVDRGRGIATDGGPEQSGTELFRTYGPRPYPDWFWCLSGGLDSTAAFLLTRDALHDNFGKRPVAVHWDTGVGLPLNRLYLEELCDRYDEQLVSWRTNQSLKRYVEENDAPGGGAHPDVRKLLKGQQDSKLTTLADDPVYVIGLRADESDPRAALPKVVEKRRHVEVYPVHRLTVEECARIVLRHEDCPINPCWLYNHATDCFCLANGDPSELDAAEKRFPWFAQRIREIEEAADGDGLRGTLGWDGLRAIEKKAARQDQEQTTLCGNGCQRKRDPAVIRAFRARLRGASVEESIAILDEAAGGSEEVRARA